MLLTPEGDTMFGMRQSRNVSVSDMYWALRHYEWGYKEEALDLLKGVARAEIRDSKRVKDVKAPEKQTASSSNWQEEGD